MGCQLMKLSQSISAIMRRGLLVGVAILCALTISYGKTVKMIAENQPILGRYELVKIEGVGKKPIKAKLDTGAYTASLNAVDIEYFKKDGAEWVRFTPVIDDEKLKIMERPLVKISKIKSRVEEQDDQDDMVASKRPVVEMKVCLAGQWESIEVNLTNRGHFNYPLLLGAKALRQYRALVDAGRRYTADPDCSN